MANKFKCKKCGHEYVHETKDMHRCPKCNVENEATEKI